MASFASATTSSIIMPTLPTTATVGIYACVDSFTTQGITGWLVNAAHPAEPLTLAAYIDEILVADGVTATLREDISSILGRPALCGFALKWKIDALRNFFHICDATAVPVEVRYEGCPLFSLMHYTSTDIAQWLPCNDPAEGHHYGKVLAIHGGTVYGTCRVDEQEHPFEVHLIDDTGGILTSVTVPIRIQSESEEREFFLRVPASCFDNLPHVLRVVFPEGIPLLDGIFTLDGSVKGEGHVDSLARDRIMGWAVSFLEPLTPPMVDAYIDGELAGSTVASIFRPDIAKLTRGNGINGFTLLLTKPLTSQGMKSLEVRLRDSGTALQIMDTVRDTAEISIFTPSESVSNPFDTDILGKLDAVTATGCSGWALDFAHPEERLVVDITINGVVVANVIAKNSRRDLRVEFCTDGCHGFTVSFPFDVQMGKDAVVTARTRKAGVMLASCKQIFRNLTQRVPLETLVPDIARGSSVLQRLCPSKDDSIQYIDIIILNKNGETYLENFFVSFERYNTYKNCTVVVIDHGSTDGSRAVCERWAQCLPVRFHNRQCNYSYSASNNFGADESTADYLLFLNNDIVFCQDILGPMMSYLDSGRADIVGIQLQSPPLSLCGGSADTAEGALYTQHLGVQFSFAKEGRPFLAYELPLNAESLPVSRCAWRVPAVTAACMMVRRTDFEKIGGFHEGYFYGYEDVDLCLYAHTVLKLKIVCANELIAYHMRGVSRSADEFTQRRVALNKGLLEQRYGAFLRGVRHAEWLKDDRLFQIEKPRIAFLVSNVSSSAVEGDFFTACELGAALAEMLNVSVCYITKKDWGNLSGIDVAICLLPDFDPRRIRASNPYLSLVAWPRNHFDTWIDLPYLDEYDEVWCASDMAARAFEKTLGRPVLVVPIATNARRFTEAHFTPNFASDYAFTGSFFKTKRQIMLDLHPEEIPFDFALFGHNWEQVECLRPYCRGGIPYSLMPQVYASTRIVIDDANHTVIHWGGVNSRVFDALAAGALVVTNTRTGSDELFDGLLPVYTNSVELKRILLYYLTHEEERKQLVKKLRIHVLHAHTYRNRAIQVRASLEHLGLALRVCVNAGSWGDDVTVATIVRMAQNAVAAVGHRWRTPAGEREKFLRFGDDIHLDITPQPEERGGDPSLMRCCLSLSRTPREEEQLLAAYDKVLVLAPSLTDGLMLRDVDVLFDSDEEFRDAMIRRDYGAWTLHNPELFRKKLECWIASVHAQCEVTQRDTSNLPVPERGASAEPDALESTVTPHAVVLFYPDYRQTNPYQTLLYSGLERHFDIRPGTINEAKKLAEQGQRVIFHQHWTSVVMGVGLDRAETESRVNAYLTELRHFVAARGVLVWTVHNAISHEVIFPDIEATLCEELGRLASSIHVHSAKVPELVRKQYLLPEEKSIVGSHGHYLDVYPESPGKTEARRRLALPTNARVFLFLGQVRAYKGIYALLDAFRTLHQKTGETCLVIAGKPVGLDAIKLERHASSNIRFDLRLIPDEELGVYCSAADFMVLPYSQVLTSGSVYLALSYGLPVIAPDTGLLADVLEDGKNGLPYAPENKNALRTVLRKAIALKDEAVSAMHREALESAATFTWDEAHNVLSKAFAVSVGAQWETLSLPAGERRVLVRRPDAMSFSRTAVVILHYQHIDDTIRSAFSVGEDGALYLVSNDPDASAFLTLCRNFPDAVVIQSPDNIGYAGGNNLALELIRHAGFEFVLLLNPDVVLSGRTLQQLMMHMDANPNTSIAGPRIVFGDKPNVVWFGGGSISWKYGLQAEHLYIGKSVSSLPREPLTVDYITGACLLLRTVVLERVGLIPEEYFLYFEETDWCLRAREQGFMCTVFLDVEAQHFKRSEEDGRPSNTFLYYYCRNALLLAARYRPDVLSETEMRIREKASKWLDLFSRDTPERLLSARESVESGIEAGKILTYLFISTVKKGNIEYVTASS